jgi:hypothetical protein
MNDNNSASSLTCLKHLSNKSHNSIIRLCFFMLLVSLFSMLSFSCTSRHYRDFDLVDQSYKLNPDSIVVLPGSLREQDLLLAAAVSEYLKKKSSFDVVSFDQVEINIPDYRHILSELKVPDLKKNKSKAYYLSKQDIGQINAVNKKFNSKYVFLVWSGDLVYTADYKANGSAYNIDYLVKVCGRLIEYPKAKIVGYSINEYSQKKSRSYLSRLNFTRWFKSSDQRMAFFFERCGETI